MGERNRDLVAVIAIMLSMVALAAVLIHGCQ
jgi:hypothetical protein